MNGLHFSLVIEKIGHIKVVETSPMALLNSRTFSLISVPYCLRKLEIPIRMPRESMICFLAWSIAISAVLHSLRILCRILSTFFGVFQYILLLYLENFQAGWEVLTPKWNSTLEVRGRI